MSVVYNIALADIRKAYYRLNPDNGCHPTTLVVGSAVLAVNHIVVEIELVAELVGPAIGSEPTLHCKINSAVHSVADDHIYFAVGFVTWCLCSVLLVDLHLLVGLAPVYRFLKESNHYEPQTPLEFELLRSALLSTPCLQSVTTGSLVIP